MKPKLFDLHCDTLYEALRQNKSLSRNDLNISFEKLGEYESFVQIFAVWSDSRIDEDMAFRRFEEAAKKLKTELSCAAEIAFCTNEIDLSAAERSNKNAVFLAVEGGKLLSDDIKRLDTLYTSGVRFLTLVWDKVCKIGGAFDTDEGLTEFGRSVVKRCFELGIIPDLSHASDKMISEVIEMADEAQKVCIATHSNSRAVCDHRRNLTDENFKMIAKLGGIVGISLAPMHLCEDHRENCDISSIIKHIEHYLSLGGENTVCLGCDLDGVSTLPRGISDVSDIYKLADELSSQGFGDDLINKLFYKNARDFISRSL